MGGSLNKSLTPSFISLSTLSSSHTLISVDARSSVRRPFSPCAIPRTITVRTPKGYSQCWVSVLLAFEMTRLINRGVTLQQPPWPIFSFRREFCSRTIGCTASSANSLYEPGVYVDAK